MILLCLSTVCCCITQMSHKTKINFSFLLFLFFVRNDKQGVFLAKKKKHIKCLGEFSLMFFFVNDLIMCRFYDRDLKIHRFEYSLDSEFFFWKIAISDKQPKARKRAMKGRKIIYY